MVFAFVVVVNTLPVAAAAVGAFVAVFAGFQIFVVAVVVEAVVVEAVVVEAVVVAVVVLKFVVPIAQVMLPMSQLQHAFIIIINF